MNILNIDDLADRLRGRPVAVVTGVTGQDGSYMADYLLENTDLVIVGGARRLSVKNHENLKHINNPRFSLVNFDLTDSHSISKLIREVQPSYFINFAAQSFVASSWDFPKQTWEANSTAVLDILEAVRQHCPTCRVYNAGSSEEWGNVAYSPQDEKHPLRPRSPYGASKCAARQLIKVYRESYGLYAVQGWLHNHESERRGEEFVTRKITKAAAQIIEDLRQGKTFRPLLLGNVDAQRDWSYAPDFIDAVWKMMNQENSLTCISSSYRDGFFTDKLAATKWLAKHVQDYVISSGETHSVAEFVELAFEAAFKMKGRWRGEGLGAEFWIGNYCVVKIDEAFYRPAEVDLLIGDASRARDELGWTPQTSFAELVEKMVEHDLSLL